MAGGGGQTVQSVEVCAVLRASNLSWGDWKAYKQTQDMERFAFAEGHFRESEMDNVERPARRLWKNLGEN